MSAHVSDKVLAYVSTNARSWPNSSYRVRVPVWPSPVIQPGAAGSTKTDPAEAGSVYRGLTCMWRTIQRLK